MPRVREVQELSGERAAIDHALDSLQPGELLVIGVEAIEESLAYVRNRLPASGGR